MDLGVQQLSDGTVCSCTQQEGAIGRGASAAELTVAMDIVPCLVVAAAKTSKL